MTLRLLLLTFIFFCLELGLFLLLLPWSRLWEQNYFLFRYPMLAPYLLAHPVRGLISGVGLLDIGVALWYAANFRAVLRRWRGQASEDPQGSAGTPGTVRRGQTV